MRSGAALLVVAIGCSGSGEPRRAPTAAHDPAPVAPASPIVMPASPPAPTVEEPPAPTDRADTVIALHAAEAPVVDGALDDAAWRSARAVPIATDWRGARANLETIAKMAWSPDALFFSFDCAYDALVVDDAAPTATEHVELYRFDAVEVFVDPDPATPDTYVELEVGPRGHFLDVNVDRGRRPHGDVAWSSGMTVAARIDEAAHRYRIEARVPAAALGLAALDPRALRIGLYRLAGRAPNRLYLARFPTLTERPSFHVPDRFGHLLLQ